MKMYLLGFMVAHKSYASQNEEHKKIRKYQGKKKRNKVCFFVIYFYELLLFQTFLLAEKIYLLNKRKLLKFSRFLFVFFFDKIKFAFSRRKWSSKSQIFFLRAHEFSHGKHTEWNLKIMWKVFNKNKRKTAKRK